MQDILYSLTIQSVVDDKVVLNSVLYRSLVISREMMREIQSLKIENNISIPGVRRRDKENVFTHKRIDMNNILFRLLEVGY